MISIFWFHWLPSHNSTSIDSWNGILWTGMESNDTNSVFGLFELFLGLQAFLIVDALLQFVSELEPVLQVGWRRPADAILQFALGALQLAAEDFHFFLQPAHLQFYQWVRLLFSRMSILWSLPMNFFFFLLFKPGPVGCCCLPSSPFPFPVDVPNESSPIEYCFVLASRADTWPTSVRFNKK